MDLEKKKARQKRYAQSEKGKATIKRNRQKPERKAKKKEYEKAYCKTEQGQLVAKKSQKRYRQSEQGKFKHNLDAKKERSRYPERIKARRLAQNNIPRQECEVVDCCKLGERHHGDYSKPLDVRFLCKMHHVTV